MGAFELKLNDILSSNEITDKNSLNQQEFLIIKRSVTTQKKGDNF